MAIYVGFLKNLYATEMPGETYLHNVIDSVPKNEDGE
ncbi:hypothetical protein MFFC18_08560 [Mariniblastus fucicola]|uniref:Uncharacterized protein n=1 Tax=Mariniblastus fucicola TaxID=980251 RepID=A0A5B9P448_9BACT|nr:hypothetical protein MFFC18_08560 [Mariniblastus fucicola]